MLKLIGIDVSKAKLDIMWLRDQSTGKVKSKIFKNSLAGHKEFLSWIRNNLGEALDDVQCVMEATGVYHEALAYYLYAAGIQVVVVNPSHVHSYSGSLGRRSKTDRKDSWVIAQFAATHRLRLWQPEAEEIRILKALIARYDAVSKDVQREKNRLEKAEISQSSTAVVESIHTVLLQLEEEKQRLNDLIDDHIDQNPGLKKDQGLLKSIPGVGPVVARSMLALIRSRNFESGRECAAFIGLIPIQHESGSSVKTPPRLSKAGDARIRAKLYMAAVVATRYNRDIQCQYMRLLKNGKSKMAALGAAMRKLVHICFGVLKHQSKYQVQIIL
jgi:transposase